MFDKNNVDHVDYHIKFNLSCYMMLQVFNAYDCVDDTVMLIRFDSYNLQPNILKL